jgi:uncharacterized repeat protein (TIGR02543 family)
MIGLIFMKKLRKGAVSLLLIISVMVSMAVPLTVNAEEVVAENSEIYAILYYIDTSKLASNKMTINNDKNIELVFQKGDTLDSAKTVVQDKNGNRGIFSIVDNPTVYTGDNSDVPVAPWYSFERTSSNQNIARVVFKDRIKPVNIDGWFRNCKNLEYENILHKENLDTSVCTSMTYLFSSCSKFSTFDFADWPNFDFSNVTNMKNMFQNCSTLYTMDLTGIDPVNCSDCSSMFSGCTSLVSFKFGSFKAGNNVRKSSGASVDGVSLYGFFKGCTKLETVDMSEIDLNFPRSTRSMFESCTAITEIDVSRMYGNTPLNGFDGISFQEMFKNCTSLEVVNFNLFPHTFGYYTIADIFKGCVSLREFYLEDAKKTNNKYNTNIFADSDNISYVALTPNWVVGYDWVPVKTTWKKVKMAKVAQTDEVEVGRELSNTELFKNFKKKYAGTWSAIADFGFNANGGTATVGGEEKEVQFVSGTKGTELNYASSIVEPTREGYSFNGWHTDRTENTPFASGDTAEQWTYYAHWTDNTYKLILNANGGYIDGSNDTRIEYNNVKYSELKKLDKDAFVNDGGKVLVGWNTRADGTGESFAADDSVSMLTPQDGGEVTLYAIWYAPQAIVSFDAQGGSAVDDKHFDNLPEDYGMLSDSHKTGYTFLGWFTEAEGGTLIEDDTPVTGSCTLYAHWQQNPVVTFDAGDGYFDDDITQKTTNKVCKYNSYIGVTPTPENGSASFLGWYDSDGNLVTSEYEVTADVTLTAHWGYVPVFDTDGGIVSNLPKYDAQSSPTFKITELPTITKENFTFLGWKHGDDWILQAGNTLPEGGVQVNLSSNNTIKAIWQQKSYVTITLDPNSGSLAKSEINPIKVYANTPIAALPTPTRDGYDFKGWYLGEDKKTVNSTFTEDATLKAKWDPQNRNVTFDAGEGEMDNSTSTNVVKTKTIKVNSGKTIPSLPGANHSEKSFGGWYSQPNGQGTKLTENTVITLDTAGTYYAYWVDNTVKDNTYKYSYYAQWDTKSDSRVSDTGDRLVFHPLNGDSLSADLKIFFQTEGTSTPVPVGGLKIKVPKYIFKDWKGNPITTNNAESGASNNITLDKTSDPDYYIYTNKAPLSGSDTVFTLNYTFSPLNVNGGYIDENGYYQGDYYVNNNVNVKIQVDMDGDGNLETDYSKTLATEVHTKVDTSVSKFRSSVSLTWDKKWGDKPADADDYFYVTWTLNSTHAYQNYSQKFYLLWDENTVRDNGTVVYASDYVAHGDVPGKWTGIQSNGTKSYTVVTKHRRDLARPTGGDQWATVSNEAILNVKWQSGYIEQFRTSASTTAYIPSSGNGDFNFQKTVPNMNDNEAHFKHGGQEQVTDRAADNMPILPYELSYTESANADNPEWNSHTSRYTAPKRTITITDGEYGAGDVVISSNDGYYPSDSWAGSTVLEDSDYYFDSLKITVKECDATKLGDGWSNPYEHTNLSDYGETEIWVRKMNSDTFTLHKELVITSKETTVSLPDDTVGYKVVHESEFFSTNILVKTNLCLNPTSNLAIKAAKDIKNGDKTLIKNKAKLNVSCGSRNTNYDSSSSTWPATYVLDISAAQQFMRKSCATKAKVDDDPSTMSEVMPVVISGWNYNNSGNKKRFTSGEFYDLLPSDFTVIKSSIFVKPITENWTEKQYENEKITADKYDTATASGTLSKGDYSVSFENDWKGSGKTMMKVKVNVPDSVFATGVSIYFKISTPYSNVYTNGTTQLNMAAYKDTTESILSPEKRVSTLEDDAIDPDYKYCFEDIDSDRTAFSSATTDLKKPPIHEAGIDSTVHAEEHFSKHQSVGINTDYTYHITYGSGVGAVTGDLVFYDVIEHRLDGLESEWEGSFKGVDVSSLRTVKNMLDPDATCEPVVYYAVKSGENPKTKDSFVYDGDTEDDDFNLDEVFWTTELPENLDDVTAIAVDCRKDSKGNDFQLKPESTIGFNINMHSTSDATENNIYTYNEAIIRFNMVETQTRVNQHTQTDVLLHYSTPEFVKTAFPSSGSDNNHPATVVKNSVLEYTLNITNPDADVHMENIELEDTLDATKVKVDEAGIRVKVGNSEATNISKSVHIKSYSVTYDDVKKEYTFNAVIASIDPKETVSIILPVTVTGDQDEKITNTAKVTRVNGVDFEDIPSNTNYHIIDDPQVKVLKVNSKDEPLKNAKLTILNDDSEKTQADFYDENGNSVTEFDSGEDVISYSILPGRYILREISTPNADVYKKAEDIKFRIDTDGFAYVDGVKTDIIKMVNEPKYKVIFHENNPEINDKNVVFKIYEPLDLNEDKSITHFYDIPEWAGDEYVFGGWFHNADYSQTPNETTPANFENDKYPNRGDGEDYHLYAKWIKVGTVSKDSDDANILEGNYRGFGLAGVQIRDPKMFDTNYNTNVDNEDDRTPGGMRFVTSLKESLLSDIDALSTNTITTDEGTVNVEYGYAVGSEDNINAFINNYKETISNTSKYKLQYKGENVNGVNTTGETRTGETDYRYITNVNCTRGTTNSMGTIKDDHRNFTNYRLYTLVVTYEGESSDKKDKKIDARSYIRYYDANGKLRVFYNDYKKNMYYGGCLCSYNQVSGMAIPQNPDKLAEQQEVKN